MGKRSRTRYIKGSPEERFWPKVNKDGPVAPLRTELGQCWLWTAGVAPSGTPLFSVEASKTINGRRWIYEQQHGPTKPGWVVAGICGTPTCINPGHAAAMTHRDALKVQRELVAARGGRKRPELCRRQLHPLPQRGACQPCAQAAREAANRAQRENRQPRPTCRYGHEYPDAQTTPGKHRTCPTCQASNRKTCSVDGCEREHRYLGFCDLHGRRWKQTGTTADPPAQRTEAERFWAKVDRSGEHWLWIGGGPPSAGQFRTADGRAVSPRRWAWVDAYGRPAPELNRMLVTCDEPLCIRPEHVEATTAAGFAAATAAAQPTCSRGHEWTPENTRISPRGVRVCRACHRNKQRDRHVAGTRGIGYVKILRGDPCSYCGAPSEHVDHIVPVTAGGRSHWSNLTAACAACNQSKQARDLLTFLLDRLPT